MKYMHFLMTLIRHIFWNFLYNFLFQISYDFWISLRMIYFLCDFCLIFQKYVRDFCMWFVLSIFKLKINKTIKISGYWHASKVAKCNQEQKSWIYKKILFTKSCLWNVYLKLWNLFSQSPKKILFCFWDLFLQQVPARKNLQNLFLW